MRSLILDFDLIWLIGKAATIDRIGQKVNKFNQYHEKHGLHEHK